MTRAVAVLLLIAGCGQDPVNITPRSFDRPGRMAFVCFDRDTDTPVPLSTCRAPIDGALDARFGLHALVAQTARGEVAAVDLRAHDLIDSDRRVPGFTFVSVGEVPSAIVVDPNDPTFTFVAGFASEDVRAIPTAIFRQPAPETEPTRVGLSEGPIDLALVRSRDSLVAVLPLAGALAEIPLAGGGTFGTPTELVLGTAVPAPVDPSAMMPPPAIDSYDKICPPGAAAEADWVAPRTFDVPPGTTPRPARVVLDELRNKLLVADEALPFIHVIDATTMVEEEGVYVGVPTRDLALTPVVPAQPTADGGFSTETARFLYAIDATDGSVLVVEWSELPVPTSPTFGAVLPVDIQGVRARDRIGLVSEPHMSRVVAQSLEILTPEFPAGVPCAPASENAEDAGPATLRGVFVAVTLGDGSVRIVDIHDLDLGCRGGLECTMPLRDDDQLVFIRRHRPRIGAFIRENQGILGAPAVISAGAAIRIENSGLTEPESVPDLAPITCPGTFVSAFPEDPEAGESLICVLADPWGTTSEQWSATWEGLIPGTQGGRGRVALEMGPNVFVGEIGFCSRGVLGAEDVVGLDPAEPEAMLAGDTLVITAELPESLDDAERMECEPLLTEDAQGERLLMAFPIVQAFDDHLVIEQRMIGPLADALEALGIEPTLGTVQRCFPELMTYEVRSRGSYVVAGTRTGFLHRVREDEASGRCAVDAFLDRRLNGRAYGPVDPEMPLSAPLYQNHLVAFQIASNPTGADATVVFTTGIVAPKLGTTEVGLLPAEVRFSPENGRLYVIDTAAQGLVELELAPFRVLRAFE